MLQFKIIGLSETWLKEYNKDIYNVDDYVGVHKIRQNRNGGGVSFYVHNSVSFLQRTDLDSKDYNVYESLFIEIPNFYTNKRGGVLVGIMYRSPNLNSLGKTPC